MKSGEASGLRAMVWNSAPESPKAAPTRTAARARGSRSSPTMNWAAGSPAPKIAGTTSVSGTRKSPIEIERQNRAKPTTASTTPTVSPRARPVDPGPPDRAEVGERGHSSASRRRRTSMTKNGAPTTAVTIPTWSSPGRATTRPITSEPSSRIGASTIEYARTQR